MSADQNPAHFEATLSVLIMSLASSSIMALGLAPQPGGQIEKDLHLAKFNIDLLLMLKEKTKGNLTDDEKKFLESVVSDLQIKFVQSK